MWVTRQFLQRSQLFSKASRLTQTSSAPLSTFTSYPRSLENSSSTYVCCSRIHTKRAPKEPPIPHLPEEEPPKDVRVENNPDLIRHLERTSLVGFESEEAVKRLQEAINFANVLEEVDTTIVEPMYTVLDRTYLRLRADAPHKTSREDILRNAAETEEDYFSAPPGNIPLDTNQLKSSSKS